MVTQSVQYPYSAYYWSQPHYAVSSQYANSGGDGWYYPAASRYQMQPSHQLSQPIPASVASDPEEMIFRTMPPVLPAKPSSGARIKNVLMAAGFLAMGLLLRRLPPRPSTFKWVSTYWADWAKMGLGVMAVRKLNQALQWTPPPWLSAIETVAVVNPLMAGFSMRSLAGMATMMPIVAGVSELTTRLNHQVAPRLEEKYHIPHWVTRLVISVATIGLGLTAFPPLHRAVQSLGIFGKSGAASGSALEMAGGMQTVVCSNGCCQSVICMTEVMDSLSPFLTGQPRKSSHHHLGHPNA